MFKSLTKMILSTLIMALSIVIAVGVAYGVPCPSTKRTVYGMLLTYLTMFIALYVAEPSIINKRIYGVCVCISAHRAVRKYIRKSFTYRNLVTRDTKKDIMFAMTGCCGYYELYRYAQEEYFEKWRS